MKRIALLLLVAAALFVLPSLESVAQQSHATENPPSYLGFDRNNYPGDQNLKVLRETFSYTGFWLNHPPSARTNTWSGKRKTLQSAGFGFLVLFNGRLFNELKSVSYASKLGKSDAQAAVAAARREGFPARTIIFLDQEQGGRMLPEQKAYIYAWVDGVTAGRFRAGIYCSGISAAKEGGEDIVTADDIRQNAGARKIVYLGHKRCLRALARLRLSQTGAKSRRQWHSLCRRMAVCPVAEEARGCRQLSGKLQPRWKLLSAWNRRRTALAHRRKYGDNGGSLAR